MQSGPSAAYKGGWVLPTPPFTTKVLPFTLRLLVFLAETDPAVAGRKELADTPQVELNPFGTWLTALTWLALIALNLWCFRKVLRRPAK